MRAMYNDVGQVSENCNNWTEGLQRIFLGGLLRKQVICDCGYKGDAAYHRH